ncbi:hypothetical protein ABW19_dt0208717 [Dactylella cylindrospora]|nr:hypothetical protein ABW19_dt0208717 [Dactylella cylindrospora]
MDDLLKPIRITSIKTSNPEETPLDLKLSSTTLIKPVDEAPAATSTASSRKPTSIDNALEILRSQPSLEELSTVLSYILSPPATINSEDATFKVTSISPLTSRLINTLIVDIIPSFWGLLTSSKSHNSERKKLLQCLRSVSGLGGITARLKLLLKQAPSVRRPENVTLTKVDIEGVEKKEAVLAQIRDLMDVLESLLGGDELLREFWEELKYNPSGSAEDRKKEMAWKEFVGLVAGGRLLSVAAEADIRLSEVEENVGRRKTSWVGTGKEYTSWLRGNIAKMLDGTPLQDEGTWKANGSVLARGFGLGYNDSLIDLRLYLRISELNETFFCCLRLLLSHLKEHEKRSYINTLLKILSQKYLAVYAEGEKDYNKGISLVSKIIYEICTSDGGLQKEYQDILLEWILVNGGPGAGESIGIRRAIIATMNASSEGSIVLQESLDSQVQTFSENLWIRHAPMIHQEVNAQCLLLCAGYVHRQPPSYLKIVARSSPFMNGISNHLASTNIRVRFLGMIVGETISTFVDPDGKQLKFTDSIDASAEEAAKWRSLVKVNDTLPGFEIFKDPVFANSAPTNVSEESSKRKPTKKARIAEIGTTASQQTTTISGASRIQELDSDDDDDLVPYPKPDSDPEDSDDDATMVNRKKPTPPVYIRDLLYMLNDHESYDKQQIALSHAAVLIRRKAAFGTEVSSHAVDLLTALAGLQDKFDMENFDNMRLKAIVALVVVLPQLSGPWISQRIFEGDYSLAQKCVMLSAIGVAAMELAGEEISDDSAVYEFQLSKSEKEKTQFPSKRLPPSLHSIYSSTPIDTISNRLQTDILKPIAEKAADELSGPSILKVRKFSSRMEVEANRKKPGVNKLSQIVVSAFFGPLMGRWWVYIKDHGNSTSRLLPPLLSLYIKTLTVLLHATGPNNLALPQMTDGFWDLLLSLRHTPIALENSTVLDAILVGFLTMFEVCGEDRDRRQMAEERGKELVETQEWVGKVFEGSDGAEGGGEARRGLAAAVLLRCREVVERYERLLMGDLIG